MSDLKLRPPKTVKHGTYIADFTLRGGLASVRNESRDGCDGYLAANSRGAVHAAAEGGRGVFHCRAAGAVEYLPAGAVHGRARRGPEIKVDAVHDPGADPGRYAAHGEPGLPLCGSVARGGVPDGIARRARGGSHWL